MCPPSLLPEDLGAAPWQEQGPLHPPASQGQGPTGQRAGSQPNSPIPPAPGQVEHMARHLEESERALQERVQRLEAARLSLEEVSTGRAGCPPVSPEGLGEGAQALPQPWKPPLVGRASGRRARGSLCCRS